MKISPVINTSTNNGYKPVKPSFTAHPDFYKFNSTQSSYFRRGVVSLVNNRGYANIESVYKELFKTDGKKQILIIGIGNSQEPFSHLASIKGILGDKPLKEHVDLYTVDLQSKPKLNDLKIQAFCDLYNYERFPEYAEKGFVKDRFDNWMGIKSKEEFLKSNPIEYYIYKYKHTQSKPQSLRYRVNDEIFEFLRETYDNPQKSKWSSPVQEVIQDYSDKKFNVVSANNVLPYINSNDKIIQTIKHINRTLKPSGYFITDPYEYPKEIKDTGALDNLNEIYKGIYQKG